MTYRLFLDDIRDPTYDAVIVRTYDQFVTCIEANGLPDHISFDHDLGEERSGYDCAMWLVEWTMADQTRFSDDFRYDVHSMNPVGRDNIKAAMIQYQGIGVAIRHADDIERFAAGDTSGFIEMTHATTEELAAFFYSESRK